MSQPESSEKPTSQPTQPSKGKGGGGSMHTGAIIGLALVAILALGFAGYTALNPHVTTVTQQQIITNNQTITNTQMQTVTSIAQTVQQSTVQQNTAQVVTVSNTQAATVSGSGSQYYQYCSSYGCMYAPGPSYNTYNPYTPPNPWVPGYYQGAYYGYYNGNFIPPCNPQGPSNNVSCSGYIFQSQNGCTVLVIPVANQFIQESFAYQYYTLRNLPSNVPSNGTWITVQGQMYNGANTSSSGASCPGNYINVSSIN